MAPAASPERPGNPSRPGWPEIVLGLVVWAVSVFGLVAQLGRLDKIRGASAGRSRVVALVEMDGWGCNGQQRDKAQNQKKTGERRPERNIHMGTAINVTVPDGHEQPPAVPDGAGEPGSTVGGRGPSALGKTSLVVEVTVVPDGGTPVPVRPTDTEDIKALERAREDAALDAEDVLTQAEEANALDPVG